MLLKLSLSLLLLVTCAHPPAEESPSTRRMENQIIALVNQYRASKGRKALRYSAAMRDAALGHSLDMARGRVPLSHRGFEKRIKAIREKTGVKGPSGENVAEGYDTAREAVDAWINSPGHRRHLLGDFDLTGVGIARARGGKLYFTQLFIAVTND